MDLPKFDPLQLDETDFIVNPDAQNICFLPLPIFTRISEMLSPSDFVHLAQTCRYMHWRMFKYGHLMLKHHEIHIMRPETILEHVTIVGKFSRPLERIIRRPYVYFEYVHVQFDLDCYSSSMFDNVLDYVSEAKKRIKHYCIGISNPQQICTQQTFQDINNLIERVNPFHLKLSLRCDRKLSVEIPNIKNIKSVNVYNWGDSRETDFLMNPCAQYRVYTVEDLRDIVQKFTKNSRLQFHVCDFYGDYEECRAMLEKEWNLKFKEADKTLRNRFRHSKSNLYASIPSEYRDVEIFISSGEVVIQRKETYIGQWEDFTRNVKSYR